MPTRQAVLDQADTLPNDIDDETRNMILSGASGHNRLYNESRLTFNTLRGQDPALLHQNLVGYVSKVSPNVRDNFLDKFLLKECIQTSLQRI